MGDIMIGGYNLTSILISVAIVVVFLVIKSRLKKNPRKSKQEMLQDIHTTIGWSDPLFMKTAKRFGVILFLCLFVFGIYVSLHNALEFMDLYSIGLLFFSIIFFVFLGIIIIYGEVIHSKFSAHIFIIDYVILTQIIDKMLQAKNMQYTEVQNLNFFEKNINRTRKKYELSNGLIIMISGKSIEPPTHTIQIGPYTKKNTQQIKELQKFLDTVISEQHVNINMV